MEPSNENFQEDILLVTDENGLEILEKLFNIPKSNISIKFASSKFINIFYNSFEKICKMSEQIPFEHLSLLFQKENSRKTSSEEDSFAQNAKNMNRIQNGSMIRSELLENPNSNNGLLDDEKDDNNEKNEKEILTNRDNIFLFNESKDNIENNNEENEEYEENLSKENYINNNNLFNEKDINFEANSVDVEKATLANSNEIEQNYFESIKKRGFIDLHLDQILLIWEISYIALLIDGIIHFCHLCFWIHGINSFLSLYMFLGIIINLFLFMDGMLGCYHVKIEKTQKINETNINLLLGILLVFTTFTFIYVEYIMEIDYQNYLIAQTSFLFLYLWMMFNEVLCMILNFKMNQYFIEFNFLLPLKYPLLGDQ